MMKTGSFQQYPDEYDRWFEENRSVYEAELRAVGSLVPRSGRGIEIGAGTGRFAVPLGIESVIEPSRSMSDMARARGLKVAGGIAEQLPVRSEAFEYTLMVTVICFVDDLDQAFQEASRILRPGGFLLVGFIDRNSPIGRIYLEHRDENVFYRQADFYAVDEVLDAMSKAGFRDFEIRQTIFRELAEVAGDEPVESGYGKGSFVVVRGAKG
ncbi:MAG: methyltransferase domain-containing protein [Deltaproteobacteria bacterium]|nr:methyltransferase domain-containing protein [Deltaproteobacteria bacterium]